MLSSRHLQPIRTEAVFTDALPAQRHLFLLLLFQPAPALPPAGWRWFAAEAMTPESSQE